LLLYGLIPVSLLVPSAFMLYAGYALAGIGLETFAIHWDVAVQREIPDNLMGRISSLAWLSSFGFMPFGQALTGPLTRLVGPTAVLWTAIAVAFTLTPATLLVPGVKRFHTPRPEEPPFGQDTGDSGQPDPNDPTAQADGPSPTIAPTH